MQLLRREVDLERPHYLKGALPACAFKFNAPSRASCFENCSTLDGLLSEQMCRLLTVLALTDAQVTEQVKVLLHSFNRLFGSG
jgi:hypothetical protein